MIILYFYSNNKMCGLVDELLQDSENDIYYIDALKNIKEVEKYNIYTTPTLVFMDRDEEIGRLIPTKNFRNT